METIAQEPVSLVLTQEELTFLLALMDVSYIPGFEAPPLASGDDQLREMYALQYAERSLRARGLAEIGADQRLLVNTTLQSMLRTCASPDYALIVQQNAGDGGQQSFSGQRRDELIVVHVESQPTFHQFSTLPDMETLVDLVINSSGLQEVQEQPGPIVRVQGQVLTEARAAIEQDNLAEATHILVADGVADDGAAALVAMLALASNLATLLELRWDSEAIVTRRDLTVVYTPTQAWLMREDVEQTGGYILHPTTSKHLRELLLADDSNFQPVAETNQKV